MFTPSQQKKTVLISAPEEENEVVKEAPLSEAVLAGMAAGNINISSSGECALRDRGSVQGRLL